MCGLALLPFIEAPNESYAAAVLTLRDAGIASELERPFVERMAGVLLESNPDDYGEIAVERTRLLRGLAPSGPKPPYEAEWASGASTQDVLADVSAWFSLAGLASSGGDRPDYLGVLLGFYQHLISSDSELRRGFLDKHLLSWACGYAEYALRQTSNPFFEGHLALVWAFLETEDGLVLASR